ncbi:MAG: hypothetical protein J5988_07555 [Eubacterium sp.]|nr:hypothetical protein [Eubacterium sp.]
MGENYNKLTDEEKTVKLDGVTSIETMVRNEDNVYPFFEQGEIVELMIGPSITEIPFELDTELGKKKLTLNRYYRCYGLACRVWQSYKKRNPGSAIGCNQGGNYQFFWAQTV